MLPKVDQTADRDTGFSVLDGVALVVAAAVASVHMRSLVNLATGAGWALVWVALAGVSLTAAGPFVLIVRKYLRRLDQYPRLGDRLWALLGTPWVVSAPFRSARTGVELHGLGLYGIALSVTLGAACLVILFVLWQKWVHLVPTAKIATDKPKLWTERLGMVLAVAWPLQFGFLLIVLDSDTLPPVR